MSPVAQLLEVLAERSQVEQRLTILTKDVMSENKRLEAELKETLGEANKLEQRVETLTTDVLSLEKQRRQMIWALERIVHIAKTAENSFDAALDMAEIAQKALP